MFLCTLHCKAVIILTYLLTYNRQSEKGRKNVYVQEHVEHNVRQFVR